ncbi:zinc finger CCCH domain-containing protein 50 [Scenedesmus sp. PABB004]|nr:zinc finger CCCH domain-containing protein 50 [Scenedesmus sp. PABB004]
MAENKRWHGRSEQDVILFFKCFGCTKAVNHDYAACFAWHNDAERRRCLLSTPYSAKMCPDMKQTGACPRGEACSMSHTLFEYWCHPMRYRTKLCKQGAGCSRPFCFFAHAEAELRQPSEAPKPLAALGAGLTGRPGSGEVAAAAAAAGYAPPLGGGSCGGSPRPPPGLVYVPQPPAHSHAAALLAAAAAQQQQQQQQQQGLLNGGVDGMLGMLSLEPCAGAAPQQLGSPYNSPCSACTAAGCNSASTSSSSNVLVPLGDAGDSSGRLVPPGGACFAAVPDVIPAELPAGGGGGFASASGPLPMAAGLSAFAQQAAAYGLPAPDLAALLDQSLAAAGVCIGTPGPADPAPGYGWPAPARAPMAVLQAPPQPPQRVSMPGTAPAGLFAPGAYGQQAMELTGLQQQLEALLKAQGSAAGLGGVQMPCGAMPAHAGFAAPALGGSRDGSPTALGAVVPTSIAACWP